jgi:hypothetical protein
MYVGRITKPASTELDTIDEPVIAVGKAMDTACRVRFRATREQLAAYYANEQDDDNCIDVDRADIISLTGRGGRDLWTNAGLPWTL